MRPCARNASRTATRASNRSMPSNSVPVPVMTPDSSMIDGIGRPCRRPISKSLGSCAGVTLTAPVPNSGSTWLVGEDRDPAPDQRQLDLAADQVPVTLVVRMHDDGGVAQHRLDPRGGHDDRVGPVAVADRHQLAVDLLVLHLDVGQHAAQRRRPVDHPLGAVDQAVVVQPLEHRADGAVAAVVHREALARPVDALAEPPHLRQDRAAVLGLPLPRALEERLAAQLAAAGALGDQRLLDERVHGDRRRGPCPAATARRSPASGGGGPAGRSACARRRGRCAGCR